MNMANVEERNYENNPLSDNHPHTRILSDAEPQHTIDDSFRARIEQRIGSYNQDQGLMDLSRCGIGKHTIDWVTHRLRLLDGLTTLNIGGNTIGDTGAVAIAERLSALTTLDISDNCIYEAGAVAIAKHLPALTTLKIRGNPIRAAGAAAIAEHLTALTTLDIWHCEIGPPGAIAIAERLALLTILDIGVNQILDNGAIRIAKSLGALTKLNIHGNNVQEWGAIAIAERLTALTTLEIGHNYVSEAGAVAIAEHLTALTTLNVDCNDIGEWGAIAIAENLTALTTLKIASNKIFKQGAIAIAENLTALTTLDIRSNYILEAGAVAIAKHLPSLTTLNIADNDIGDRGVVAIAEHLPALTTLDIGSNDFGNLGATAIAEHLAALTALYIVNNGIGNAGAVAIARCLTALTTLYIGCNKIGNAGAASIVKHRKALTTLHIEYNKIDDAGAVVELLQKHVCANASASLQSIGLRGNPLEWPGMDAPISEETLEQEDPTKLLQLLLDSRPGMGEELSAARVTMAGLGMSGKTRLSRWLVDHPRKRESIDPHDRTVGIEPLETTLNGRDFERPELGEILLTVLDCGGQQEQLQSHHNLVYKASGRSVFVLCLHAGKDFASREGNRADYYLRMLQSYQTYGERPLPVLIVVTHGELTGSARKLDIPKPAELLQRYPRLHITKIDPYLGDLGHKIEDVRRAIVDLLVNMQQLRAVLPKGTLKLRQAMRLKFQLNEPLPADPREMRIKYPALTPEQFREICMKCGVTNEASHGDRLRLLSSLGTLIAPGVEKTIGAYDSQLDSEVSRIFNPRYVNQHVYGLLMNNDVREQNGFMSQRQFRDETPKLNKAKRDDLLQFLKRYLIAFEWKHADMEGLLIPDLLPERTIPAQWDDSLCRATLRFNVFSLFLGEHRFFEFLSLQKDFIKPLGLNEAESCLPIRPIGVFRNEACVRRDPCEALVQIDVIESRIDVAVRGGTIEDAVQLRDQIIGNLTYLDPPDAVEIERWRANPAKLGPKRMAVGKGKHDLAELQTRIEKFVESHGFPWPQKMLADRFKCKANSLSVIVNRSNTLKAARELQRLLSATKGRKHQAMEGAVLNSTKNLSIRDPDEEAAVQEQYHLMRDFSREAVLSELCSYLDTEKNRQNALKLAEHQTTEFLQRTLAVHKVKDIKGNHRS